MTARTLAVVGMGKLGLPLATLLAEAGHLVYGVDQDEDRIAVLRDGGCPIVEPGVADMLDRVRGRLVFTSDVTAAGHAEMSFVVVPTPSLPSGAFDSTAVQEAASRIGQGVASHGNGHTLVVVSTVMPGDTAGPVQQAVDQAAGRHVPCVYSPEFIALGSVLSDMRRPDVVLVGSDDPDAGHDVAAVLASIDSGRRNVDAGGLLDDDLPGGSVAKGRFTPTETHVLSTVEAEVAKLAVNVYLTVKVAFTHTVGAMVNAHGGNARRVLDAVGADSRIGRKFLSPGPPVSGPCLPRDGRAWVAASGEREPLAEGAQAEADRQRWRIARRVAVADFGGRVAVLGLTYKPGSDVTDEAIGPWLADELDVDVTFDPLVPCTHPTAQAAVDAAEVVVLATPDPAWRDLDYAGTTIIDLWGLPVHTEGATYIGPS